MDEVFVGRRRELGRMLSTWNEVLEQTARTPRVILIEGEAGIGKSALINEFINDVQRIQKSKEDKVWIGKGCCEIFEAQVAFLPFYQVLDSLRSQIPSHSRLVRLDQFNQLVSEVAPSWFKMLPVVGESIGGMVKGIRVLQKEAKVKVSFAPSQQPDADIYAQYLKVLRHLSGRNKTPIIIVLDDLQWVDQASLHLLAYLGKRLPDLPEPIMVVGACRSRETHIQASELAHQFRSMLLTLRQRRLCVAIPLRPFSAEDANEYIDRLYALEAKNRLANFPQVFREVILSQTAGNPLFLSELLRTLEERNCIVKDHGGWKLKDYENAIQELPDTLQAALEERIGRLEGCLRDLLTVASVEGENFTAQVAARINRVEFATVLDLLVRELSRNYGLVRELGEREITYRKYLTLYAFRHGLIRNFIYDRLSNAQKRIFHQQVAECLEDLYGEDNTHLVALQLARHYWIAKDYPKIAKYGLVAARQEFEKYAVHQTIWWCRNVVDVLLRFPDVPNSFQNPLLLLEAMLLQVEAHVHLGQHDDAIGVMNCAENYLDKTSVTAAQFAYWRAKILIRLGNHVGAIETLQSALSIFHEGGMPEWETLALAMLGHSNAVHGRFELAHSQWDAGIRLARAAGSAYSEALIWSDIGVFSNDQGDLEGAETASRTALEIYQALKSKRGEAASLRTLADVEYIRGNLAKAEALIRRAVELAHEVEDEIYIVWCSNDLARCLIDRGRYDDAEQVALESLRRCLEMNEAGFAPEAYISLTEIVLHRGDYERATQYVREAINIVAEEDFWTWSRTRYTMGKVLIAQGRVQEAEAWMRSAYDRAMAVETKLMKGYTQYEYAKQLYLSGQLDKALGLANESRRILSEIGARLKLEKVLVLESRIQETMRFESQSH